MKAPRGFYCQLLPTWVWTAGCQSEGHFIRKADKLSSFHTVLKLASSALLPLPAFPPELLLHQLLSPPAASPPAASPPAASPPELLPHQLLPHQLLLHHLLLHHLLPHQLLPRQLFSCQLLLHQLLPHWLLLMENGGLSLHVVQ